MDKNVDELIVELAERGVHLPKGNVGIGGIGDSEALSQSLITLILTGVKRGTCSLVWSWDFDGETPPEVGNMEIVLDWHGRPTFVRRTTEVEIVPFDAVTADSQRAKGKVTTRYRIGKQSTGDFSPTSASELAGRLINRCLSCVRDSRSFTPSLEYAVRTTAALGAKHQAGDTYRHSKHVPRMPAGSSLAS